MLAEATPTRLVHETTGEKVYGSHEPRQGGTSPPKPSVQMVYARLGATLPQILL
jgi:hypothetical protein